MPVFLDTFTFFQTLAVAKLRYRVAGFSPLAEKLRSRFPIGLFNYLFGTTHRPENVIGSAILVTFFKRLKAELFCFLEISLNDIAIKVVISQTRSTAKATNFKPLGGLKNVNIRQGPIANWKIFTNFAINLRIWDAMFLSLKTERKRKLIWT